MINMITIRPTKPRGAVTDHLQYPTTELLHPKGFLYKQGIPSTNLYQGMIVEMGHPLGFTYRTIATGIKFSETPVSIDILPPELGGDTVEVLRLVGYGEEEIDQMIGEGVAHA